MKPTIGRIVIFRSPGSGLVNRPAIIVSVNEDGSCNLVIFMDTPRVSQSGDVPRDTPAALARRDVFEGTDPDTWHWPPRV